MDCPIQKNPAWPYYLGLWLLHGVGKKLLLFVLLFSFSWGAQAQRDVAGRLGYPDFILYNAKIVTMDDSSFESKVGTIAPAMAVRGDKILATGTDAEIRALAGPQTRQVDLHGRTVLPSFILTHEHPTDWAFAEPEALKHALPEDNGFVVIRWLKGNAQEQLAQWEAVLQEAATNAKPGQWIWLSTDSGPHYEYVEEVWKWFSKVVTKERLDQIVPNHPVRVKKDWPLNSVINSKAWEEIRKVYPELDPNRAVPDRLIEPDVIFQGRTALLAKVLQAEMELWAAHGITTFGSSAYAYHNFQALSYLDRNGEMPARFAWSFRGQDYSLERLQYLAGMTGHGTDHLWLIGAQPPGSGGSCTSLGASPEVKTREQCSFAPGAPDREILENIIRTGGRIAAMHSGGDKDIDYYLDAIAKVSREAGLSLDEIRAKRHAFDHSSGAPRPDQIPILKNLGMMVSMLNTLLWENHQDYDTSARVRNYGIEYANWAMPRKSTTEAGVMSTFEIDRPLPHLVFLFIHKGITRYNDRDKKVYGPGEKTDRIIQLKALTTWGSYYVLKENLLGSLEPGKWADFIVLDRDYLTIPEDQIPNIQVLMTVVGGKTIHLMPSLARETGMQAVGPVTWETKPLETYYSRKQNGTQ